MLDLKFFVVDGLAVLIVTSLALGLSLLLRKDAATKAGLLFCSVCVSLCLPFLVAGFQQRGVPTWMRIPERLIVVEAANGNRVQPSPHNKVGVDVELGEVPSVKPNEANVLASPATSAGARDTQETDNHVTFDPQWLIRIWAVGVILFLLRIVGAWRSLYRIASRAALIDDPRIEAALAEACRDGSTLNEINVYESRAAVIPFAMGLTKTRIILPKFWRNLGKQQLTDVLLHERAHLVRRDPLKLLVQQFVAALYWPIPTVHLVNRSLDEAREEVCDNRVLASRDPIAYGETLLKVASMAARKLATGGMAPGILGKSKHLEHRVLRIVSTEPDACVHPSKRKLFLAVTLLAVFGSAIGSLAATPQEADSGQRETTVDDTGEVATDNEPLPPPTDSSSDASNYKLNVRVVDKQGMPIPNAEVLLFDEAKILAGKERRFRNVLKRSDAQGNCDFGELPIDHVAILVRRRVGVFDESTVHLMTRDTPHATANRLVSLGVDGDTLTLTHTMRRGIELKFEVIDAKTKEPIHFAAVFWKDVAANRWWHISLLDSGGQHDFTTLVPEMSRSLFRASRLGYKPVDFGFGRPFEIGSAYTRRIELEPQEDVRLTIQQPDGKPAQGATVSWSNPDGLINEEEFYAASNADGVIEVRYPPHPDVARLTVDHPSGALTMPFAKLPADRVLKLTAPPTKVGDGARSVLKGRFVCDVDPLPARLADQLEVNGEDGGLRDLVVWIRDAPEGTLAAPELAEKTVTIENGSVQPRVTLLQTNQRLKLINREGPNRNLLIDAYRNQPFNLLLERDEHRSLKFAHAERLPFSIRRTIAPGRVGSVLVQNHPFMAVTDVHGRFQISAIPHGEWVLQFWHPHLGYIRSVRRDGEQEFWRRGRVSIKFNNTTVDLGKTIVNTAEALGAGD